jgi:hypothetical protein
MCHMSLPAHALRVLLVRVNSISNEGHFTLEGETVFRLYLLSHFSGVTEMCHTSSLRMRNEHCKFGWTLSVMKGLLRPKIFGLCNPRIAMGWLIYATGIPCAWELAVQARLKSDSNEGHFILEGETVLTVSPLLFQWDERNMPHGTQCACAKCSASYVEAGE